MQSRSLITVIDLHSVLKPLIRAALTYLLSVLAIAAVLIGGKYVIEGVKGAYSAREQLALLVGVQDEVERYRAERVATLAQGLTGAGQLPLAAIDERIGLVTRELASTASEEAGELEALLQAGPQGYAERLAARYKTRLARAVLLQELGYLQQVRAHLFALQSRAAASAELSRLLGQHRAVYARLLQKQREVSQLGWVDAQRFERPWARSPKLDRLAAEVRSLSADNARAAAAYRTQLLALQRMQSVTALAAFTVDHRQLDQAVQPLRDRLADARAAVSRNWFARLAEPLKRALPLAAGILLLALAGKAGIKALFYFALAPLVTRGAPVRLDPARPGGPAEEGGKPPQAVTLLSASAVSQTVSLAPGEELLVLPSYLQSAPVGAARATRWLIAGRPWASLTSGMALLTCVQTRHPGDGVVLSASDDGLSEIALLRIPAGQALVIRPRALVGVAADRRGPIDIGWQWRLASLHAWLTLQLRYFVIRGPLTLAVQGRRGVRVQAAQASHTIRQTATLGFSTDVAYSTVRSEPFLPYLRGQAPLLYDRFGGAGVYLYDETPGGGRQGRISRGLEGITDALLKLVGY